MLEYVHFTPGRLRLKITELKQRERAVDAEADVARIRAVTSALANSTTGSLTINFDERQVSIRDLWEILCDRGYASGGCPTAVGSVALEAEPYPRIVATALVDAIVKHYAQVLINTLL